MRHRYHISRMKNWFVALLWNRMDTAQDLSFVLAFAINIMILLGFSVTVPTREHAEEEAPYVTTFRRATCLLLAPHAASLLCTAQIRPPGGGGGCP